MRSLFTLSLIGEDSLTSQGVVLHLTFDATLSTADLLSILSVTVPAATTEATEANTSVTTSVTTSATASASPSSPPCHAVRIQWISDTTAFAILADASMEAAVSARASAGGLEVLSMDEWRKAAQEDAAVPPELQNSKRVVKGESQQQTVERETESVLPRQQGGVGGGRGRKRGASGEADARSDKAGGAVGGGGSGAEVAVGAVVAGEGSRPARTSTSRLAAQATSGDASTASLDLPSRRTRSRAA